MKGDWSVEKKKETQFQYFALLFIRVAFPAIYDFPTQVEEKDV